QSGNGRRRGPSNSRQSLLDPARANCSTSCSTTARVHRRCSCTAKPFDAIVARIQVFSLKVVRVQLMRNLFQLISILGRWSKGIRHSRTMIALAVVASFLAGVGYTMLLALIKKAVSEGLSSQPNLVWMFVVFCLAIPICGFASQ